MPRKRVPAALRETPEARAMRAAVAEEMEFTLRALGETPEAAAKSDRKARKFIERVERRGGTVEAMLAEIERDNAKAAKKAAKNASEPTLRPEPVVARAVRRAAEPEPDTDAPAGPPPPRRPRLRKRRGPAGFVGYIDPRLFDTDDWDDQ